MKSKKIAILRKTLEFLTKNEDKKLTMSNVAKAIDIGKSTIYEYFENKDEMIKEALILMIDENCATIVDVESAEANDFKSAFYLHMERAFMVTQQNYMMQHMQQNANLVAMPKRYKEEIKLKIVELLRASKERMQSILVMGIEEGVIDELSSKERSITIEGLLLGSVLNSKNPLNEWRFEDTIDDVYACLVLLHR